MKRNAILLLSLIIFPFFSQCSTPKENNQTSPIQKSKSLEGLSTAYFASGCFWCVEAVFESVKGVEEAVSGYSGGREENPTYQQVSAGRTSHAEAVKVYYDPNVVSFATLVKAYYGSHDPTTVNGQHPDYGSQYRSIAFYQNEKEKETINAYISTLESSGAYNEPIATEVLPFQKFWEAEAYHQDYEKRNPNVPYVQRVSIPRLRKFQRKYPELLKAEIKSKL